MKKIKFVLAASTLIVLFVTACNNSGNSDTTSTDTTAKAADTIKSDPTKFSDPH